MENDIEARVRALMAEIGENPFGERVVLVAATKTRSAEEIDRAIRAGVGDVGENRVQEFVQKYDKVQGARRHFIGRLQKNKVKYLIGKTFLIHSVDSDGLAAEIGKLSLRAGKPSDVLIEINAGKEASKGGYSPEEGFAACARLMGTEGLNVKGFMTVLPAADEKALLPLCAGMRALFERARERFPQIEYLSMGMSGDWRLCVAQGANMIRLGTAIFGERNARTQA